MAHDQIRIRASSAPSSPAWRTFAASVTATVVAATLTACPAQKDKIDLAALLKEAPEGAYVAGTATGLGDPEVLNQNDFIYAVAFSERGDALAWVHHVTTNMEMSVASMGKIAPRITEEPRFQVPVNHHEFDVEDLVFTGAEKGETPRLVLPSRQGVVRQYNSDTGKLVKEFIYGEPLVRAAINPSRTLVAVGSNFGRVILLDAKTLAFRGEAMLHEDEVHGLAFKDDRTLLTGGFDRKVHEVAIDTGGLTEFAVASTSLKSGEQLFIAHLDGAQAVSTVRDARQQHNIITTAAVKRMKLTPADVGTVKVTTSVGDREVPAVNLGELRIRHLNLGQMVAGVCDYCLPVGSELLLGLDSLSRVQLADDVANEQVIVRIGKTKSALAAPQPEAPAAPAATPAAPKAEANVEGDAPTEPADPKAKVAQDGDAATSTPPAAAEVVKPVAPKLATIADNALTMKVVRTLETVGPVTDISVDAPRRRALVTYSHAPALRSYDVYDAEKNGDLPPPSAASAGVLLDLPSFAFGKRFVGHEGFTVAGAISPDGRTVATGGWDKRVLLFDVATGDLITEREEGWLIRQLRFSPDGQTLAVATWTPAKGTIGTLSDPSLILYPVQYKSAEAEGGGQK